MQRVSLRFHLFAKAALHNEAFSAGAHMRTAQEQIGRDLKQSYIRTETNNRTNLPMARSPEILGKERFEPKTQLHFQHLVVSAETDQENQPRLTERILAKHIINMVEAIGMTVLIPPRVAYSLGEGNTGYTGLIGLTTSHLSFHHWDCLNPGVLQYDIFSAKRFDCDVAMNAITEFWRCRVTSAILIDRSNPLSVKSLVVRTARRAGQNGFDEIFHITDCLNPHVENNQQRTNT